MNRTELLQARYRNSRWKEHTAEFRLPKCPDCGMRHRPWCKYRVLATRESSGEEERHVG